MFTDELHSIFFSHFQSKHFTKPLYKHKRLINSL